MTKVPSQSRVHPWAAGEWPELLTLNNDFSTEVLVVGAGIAGLTTAYQLAKLGIQVAVIDASMPTDGETGNTSAHLSSALDETFQELEGLFGQDGSRLAAKSHRYAIDAIQAICEQEKIDCQFERVEGHLFAASERDNNEIRKEYEAATRAGFVGLELQTSTPFAGFYDALTLKFPNQGQFQPVLYMQGLTRALKKMGVPIYHDCEAVEFVPGDPIKIHTQNRYVISTRELVIATNSPMNNRFRIHTKQAPYRTYICQFAIEKGSVPKGLYWDTEDPYHYIRTQDVSETESVLIVGGEDHKVGQDDHAEERWTALEQWVRKNIPQAGKLTKRWSGQVNEPVDGLAYIGRNPGEDHVYIVTGDSGHGLTHGTIAGLLISDLIAGRENPWEKLYSPSRMNRHAESMKEFFKENLNVALQYKDYVTPGDVSSIDDIAAGEGAVVRHGLKKIAVYRDESNKVHACSAVCPHLGGIVHWNKAEKTWDCPCHGSRFDVEGRVVNGPSLNPLKPAFVAEKKKNDK